MKRLTILFLTALGFTILASATASAQSSELCDILWSKTQRPPPGGTLRTLRDFVAKCPRDRRAAGARTRIASIEHPVKPPPVQVTPRPRPTQPVPRPPVIQSAPVLPSVVIVDATGGGDVRTLREGVERVAIGGTVRIRGAVNSESFKILISIRLQGEVANGHQSALWMQNGPLILAGPNIVIDNLAFQSNSAISVLRVDSGSVQITNSQMAFVGTPGTPRSKMSDQAALYVAGGYVTVSQTTLGPGSSQAVAVGGGSLTLDHVTVNNSGASTGIFAHGQGVLTVRRTKITTATGVSALGSARLVVEDSRFEFSGNRDGRYSLDLSGQAGGTFSRNTFVGGTDTNWLFLTTTVPASTFTGNTDTAGRLLVIPARSAP